MNKPQQTLTPGQLFLHSLIKFLLNAVAIWGAAKLVGGVYVADFWMAMFVAFVITLLNVAAKPLIIFLTLPITILTLGVFLIFINAIIIMLADYLINDNLFYVKGFWWAFLFSIIIAVIHSFLENIFYGPKESSVRINIERRDRNN